MFFIKNIFIESRIIMNLKQRANQLKRDIPVILLALKKKETPWYAKVMAILTISYALSPIKNYGLI